MTVDRYGVLRTLPGRMVVVLAALISVLAILLVVAAARNDLTISSDEGTATAEVLSADHFRSAIVYVTPDGETHNPSLGVLYPANLAVGQRIEVEYAQSDPDLVRVAGRNATTAIIPALSVVVATWLVAALLLFLIGRRTRTRTGIGSSAEPDRAD